MPGPSSFSVRHADWTLDQSALQAIRREVFVVEQQVPENEEWDDMDAACMHVLASSDDGAPIGTGRLLPDGRIGRMAVLKAWRGCGAGSALLRELLTLARDQGHMEVWLHAQTHALGFYRKHGFTPVGGEFMEAGIPHYEMRMLLIPQAGNAA